MNYVLKDGDKYYVAEGIATLTVEHATIFSSIEDMVLNVPIMKDWNWDYELFSIDSEFKTTKIVEKEWTAIHKKLKNEGRLIHLDGVSSSFKRITYS